ncbi:unnamed protein product [Adineta steineri]|uniref:Uncharacterized protein n=2 Tax=Adineta steineri TaxID=433720 RepID=A0A815BPZ9_9BILA|nr:unnamed protein product [Adineta steineri]
MAVANNKTHCFTCNKEKITYPCRGCSKEFCLTHLTEHQQMLNEELNHIINDYDEFKQKINQQRQNPQNHSLIKQIDQWERKSIELIQQKAQEYREILVKSSQTCVNDIEKKFNDLCEQIKQIHAENEFNEINLNDLRNQLNEITEELNNSSNISIQQESQSFIDEISIISSKKPKFNKWKQTAITVAAGNGQGQQLNQLNHPAGIFIDKNKNIFIADRDNHRIVEWKHNANEGQTIAGENKQGNRMHQLGRPIDVIVDEQNHSIIIADLGNRRVIQWMNQNQDVLVDSINCQGLAMNKNEFLYVSDSQRNEVIRWKMGDNEAIVVAGGNGQGNQRNQLDFPTFIFVDKDQAVYVSDFNNHRVMKWRKESKFNKWKQNAITVAGGNGEGQRLNQLNNPIGIFIDKNKSIFIADLRNHRIVEWKYNAKEGQIIAGGNGKGNRMDQLKYPTDVIVDEQNHSIIIADRGNRRVIQWVNQNQQVLIENIHCFHLATDKHGFLYVSDTEKNAVRRWKMGEYSNEGIIVAGGNEEGDQLNQLNTPTFIFIDEEQSVYVSDLDNYRVMKWRKDAKEGTVVAGGNGYGENLNQLSYPQGVAVDHLGQIYVADWENHRVMRWCEGKKEGEIVVGGNGQGNQSNQLYYPRGLSFDGEGNLYVADSNNHRIIKFEIIL